MVNTRRALLPGFSSALFCKIRLHQIKMKGTLSEADLHMDSVHPPGQNYFPSANFKKNAALSLSLDFLFLIVYAFFISLSCIRIATALKGVHSIIFNVAVVLAWAQFIAAILDAIENLALIHLLLNSSRKWLPGLARWCAIVKFSIVGTGLIFIWGGLLALGLKKYFHRSE